MRNLRILSAPGAGGQLMNWRRSVIPRGLLL
jgi:hypothetical protein